MSQSGRTIRDAQLAMFSVTHGEVIDKCRALAVAIAKRDGCVSINEIREQMPLPPGVHPSVYGAVLRGKQFRAIGYTEALHPAAHARAVRVYTLREASNG
jgi:hypothetical protein